MSYLSVSTWSLHRLLGPLRFTAWNAETGKHEQSVQEQPQALTLLELPAELARRGYQAAEVCHFHFPSVEPAYLHQLREAFSAANLSFDTLLLDYGDLTSEDAMKREEDIRFMREWIDIAALAGAKQIRIIAGDAKPDQDEAIRMSADALIELGRYATEKGVRVISENFKALTSTGSSCVKLLERVGDAADFITDFGNFKYPTKYEEFALTLPRSVSVHAKAQYDGDGLPDREEFIRCLETVRTAKFNGAIVLIYDGPGDMWAGLDRIKEIVAEYL
ncbi:sugar phosphate isomerase/epimerase family protein [Paenibacillus montanisoli]|uniref:Sugar phosphate isomerase/epimerase n=1 Tax=Paenibacillus montanisoli TaxID=2081970 RepID=A0A328TX17_9BACL|nr:TIM barrel protein [Paenibacillus montanisoli]RAP73631.1 sugar phosphate isomerase/epimerase [Paenibacillus montanisoli]